MYDSDSTLVDLKFGLELYILSGHGLRISKDLDLAQLAVAVLVPNCKIIIHVLPMQTAKSI